MKEKWKRKERKLRMTERITMKTGKKEDEKMKERRWKLKQWNEERDRIKKERKLMEKQTMNDCGKERQWRLWHILICSIFNCNTEFNGGKARPCL